MVGFVKTIETDIVQLGRVLGRALKAVRHDNPRTTGPLTGELDPVFDWDRADRRNRFDQMLYDRARSCGVGEPRTLQLWS